MLPGRSALTLLGLPLRLGLVERRLPGAHIALKILLLARLRPDGDTIRALGEFRKLAVVECEFLLRAVFAGVSVGKQQSNLLAIGRVGKCLYELLAFADHGPAFTIGRVSFDQPSAKPGPQL